MELTASILRVLVSVPPVLKCYPFLILNYLCICYIMLHELLNLRHFFAASGNFQEAYYVQQISSITLKDLQIPLHAMLFINIT